MPYWCVSSGGTSSTAMTLPPCLVVGFDALGEALRLRRAGHRHHVRQQHRERLVADDLARAPDGVAEAERRLLAGERAIARRGEVAEQRLQLLDFAAPSQRVLKLVGDVEMILDHRLVAAGDENEMLDAGRHRLVDDVLQDRPVDHRQHLLRHAFGGGQEAGAETGDRQDGFADCLRHLSGSLGAPGGALRFPQRL